MSTTFKASLKRLASPPLAAFFSGANPSPLFNLTEKQACSNPLEARSFGISSALKPPFNRPNASLSLPMFFSLFAADSFLKRDKFSAFFLASSFALWISSSFSFLSSS